LVYKHTNNVQKSVINSYTALKGIKDQRFGGIPRRGAF